MKIATAPQYRGITLQYALGLVSITLEDGYSLDLGLDARRNTSIVTESQAGNDHRDVLTDHVAPDLVKELSIIAEAMQSKQLSEVVWITYPNGAESMKITGDKEKPPVVTSTVARNEKGQTQQGFSIATGMHDDDELPFYLKASSVLFSTPNRLVNDTDALFGFGYGLMSLVQGCVSGRRPDWEQM